jgi:hypothetical protein
MLARIVEILSGLRACNPPGSRMASTSRPPTVILPYYRESAPSIPERSGILPSSFMNGRSMPTAAPILARSVFMGAELEGHFMVQGASTVPDAGRRRTG